MRLFKNIKRFIKAVLAFVALCVLTVVGINAIVLGSTYKDVITAQEAAENKYQCILVLGCSVWADGTPSPALKSRLDKAVELYNMGVAEKILMSGDHSGQYYNEVRVMKQYAVEKGVPSEDIFSDHYGISTYDSMYRAKSIFNLESVLVVSQGYHVGRGVYDAKQFGIEAHGVASTDGMSRDVKTNIREMMARCKDFIFCLFDVDIKYGGSTVDVSGNGDSTDVREELAE